MAGTGSRARRWRRRAIRSLPRCDGRFRPTSGARAKLSVARPPTAASRSSVYIRAKIGFCNCLTGVSDDNELDRLSDFNLMGDKPAVLGPGHEIKIAWMKGRSRAYAVTEPYHAPSSVLAIAFNDRCDAIVATATVAHDGPKAIEPSVIDFLNSEVIVHWAEVTLGL